MFSTNTIKKVTRLTKEIRSKVLIVLMIVTAVKRLNCWHTILKPWLAI
ncbi:TPA: hypothetical protein ACGN81_004366 [Bacillus cereus]